MAITIKTAKEANSDWKNHIRNHCLEFVPVEKECRIANLIDEANGRGVASTVYSVWKDEIYNGMSVAKSICAYLDAMGYSTHEKESEESPDKCDIVIQWDNPKEN